MADHLSQLQLLKLAQGTTGVAETVRVHLAGCAPCGEALQKVQQERTHFAERVYARTVGEVENRVAGRRSPWWWLMLVPALGALFVTLRPELSGTVATKGANSGLAVVALREQRTFPVHDGDPLMPGDRLQFEVDPGGLPYLLLVSVDAAGHVSTYVPFGGDESVALEPGKPFESPASIELDAVPGPERIFVLLSQKPIRVSAVEPALRRLGELGPSAIRSARDLPVEAEGQKSFLWENHSP